jgi:predicted nucleic acid-binding Zn ribbon protein
MPLREYRCTKCGGQIEQLRKVDGTVLHNITWECICYGGDMTMEVEEVVCAPAIRFKGPGFHVNDYGPGSRYTFSSESKKRQRQEIRDAHERGEIPDPEPPAEKLNVEGMYGKGARKPLAQAIKGMGDKDTCEVVLPDKKTVRIRRKDRRSFGLSQPT